MVAPAPAWWIHEDLERILSMYVNEECMGDLLTCTCSDVQMYAYASCNVLHFPFLFPVLAFRPTITKDLGDFLYMTDIICINTRHFDGMYVSVCMH